MGLLEKLGFGKQKRLEEERKQQRAEYDTRREEERRKQREIERAKEKQRKVNSDDESRKDWLKHGIEFNVVMDEKQERFITKYFLSENETDSPYDGLTDKEIKEDYYHDKTWQFAPVIVNLKFVKNKDNFDVFLEDTLVGNLPDNKIRKFTKLYDTKGIHKQECYILGGNFKYVDNSTVYSENYGNYIACKIEFNQ